MNTRHRLALLLTGILIGVVTAVPLPIVRMSPYIIGAAVAYCFQFRPTLP
ncbi:MAG: hypothetical protein OXG65_14235 [Chloroflexi bacterium]|nr:hypothetical protein [Chloroflexota bacterium]